jgi:hypothetical protein
MRRLWLGCFPSFFWRLAPYTTVPSSQPQISSRLTEVHEAARSIAVAPSPESSCNLAPGKLLLMWIDLPLQHPHALTDQLLF